MPTYCYRRGNGEIVEITMRYAEMLERQSESGEIVHEGETLVRDVEHEHRGAAGSSAGWPLWSDAAAVHPDDVPKVSESLRRHGVLCEFDRLGRPKFENAAHRRSVLGRFAMHDRNSYV
jgi:hypothetical protein